MMSRKRAERTPSEYRDLQIDTLTRLLRQDGLHEEAQEALAALTVSFNRHEPGNLLPCVCGDCLPRPWEVTVEGERFLLDFVVVARRSFFFWVPVALAGDRDLVRLRHSMRASVSERINKVLHEQAKNSGAPSLPDGVQELLSRLQTTSKEIPF